MLKDVLTFPLKSYVIDLLELQITSDYSVSFRRIPIEIFVVLQQVFKLSFMVVFVYLKFAEKFHTLALEGVPVFGLHNRSAAYRFVTLVDVSSVALPFQQWRLKIH